MPPPAAGDQGPYSWAGLPSSYAATDFARFLESRHVTVLDVVPGAARGTRRLLVGDPSSGQVSYATTVSQPTGEPGPTAREELVLTEVRPGLSGSLRQTLPEPVAHVEVFTNLDALVVTGVPGLRPLGQRPDPPPPQVVATAMQAWLHGVWQQTSGENKQVTLGRSAIEVLIGRYAGTAQLANALELLRATRARLDDLEVPGTLTHGCLCPRHIMFEQDQVVGVDDWGLGSPDGDPLRDLGEYTVRLAGTRLPEVLTGTSPFAVPLRQLVANGLGRLGLPRSIWRHVLLLAQLELTISALEQGNHDEMLLLVRSVEALPRRTS
jgi:hypothetical protein